MIRYLTMVNDLFTVHEPQGFPTEWTGQDGQIIGDGARDMTTALCGEAFRTVSSFGIDANLPEDITVLFEEPDIAFQWWYDEVVAWGETLNDPHRDTWKHIHLYWRVKPAFHTATYLAMDQGGLLRTRSPLAAVLQIDIGFVTSEMLLSKLNPDGKED